MLATLGKALESVIAGRISYMDGRSLRAAPYQPLRGDKEALDRTGSHVSAGKHLQGDWPSIRLESIHPDTPGHLNMNCLARILPS